MSPLERETDLKLDILASLARSQKALARLMECVGDIGESSERMKFKLLDNLNVIGRYQMALGSRIAGVRIRSRKRGAPGKPWLNKNA